MLCCRSCCPFCPCVTNKWAHADDLLSSLPYLPYLMRWRRSHPRSCHSVQTSARIMEPAGGGLQSQTFRRSASATSSGKGLLVSSARSILGMRRRIPPLRRSRRRQNFTQTGLAQLASRVGTSGTHAAVRSASDQRLQLLVCSRCKISAAANVFGAHLSASASISQITARLS